MRAITGLPVVVPADPAETRAAVRWAADHDGPSYLRIPRYKVPAVTPADAEFQPGRAVQLTDGDDVTVLAVGTLVSRALDAARLLQREGIGVRVLNVPFIHPLDEEAVLTAARQTGAVVTAEEAIVTGGLGAAVASLVVQNHPVPMRILGVSGFAPTGSASFLLEHFGLTVDGIVDAVHRVLGHGER
jgi:transketolase